MCGWVGVGVERYESSWLGCLPRDFMCWPGHLCDLLMELSDPPAHSLHPFALFPACTGKPSRGRDRPPGSTCVRSP